MTLTKGLIRADIIAARQAIEYFEEKHIRDMKILPHITSSRQLRN